MFSNPVGNYQRVELTGLASRHLEIRLQNSRDILHIRRCVMPVLFREFERSHRMVKVLRNEIGGQVLHEKIQEALNIEFVSLRENIDTGGPLGRAMVVIVGAIAELVKSLIVERGRAGMRRAKLEGRRIGRAPLNIDRPPPRRFEPDGSSEEAADLQSHCLPLSK